jgi:hypothetical protein
MELETKLADREIQVAEKENLIQDLYRLNADLKS